MSDLKITGFEIIDKIGQGGMASVYKALQISLNRTVAIKVMSSKLASDPSDVQRFQAEAQAAAKLKHPSIVQVYDANYENSMYFFVMEFVAGYTVGDWLKRKGKLAEHDILLVAECVADALNYAWEREKIVHCDIKPDNIMIDSDGTVKVTDLGLARTISSVGRKEETDEVLGTPAFMSPEQAMGEDLDCRADIYSLGATMYTLATGTILFCDFPDDTTMNHQISDSVENPLDLNLGLSRPFCQLLRAMLAKDKKDRHADWSAVKSDIAKVKKNLMPQVKLSEKSVSTIKPGKKQAEAEQVEGIKQKRMKEEMASSGKPPIAVWIILLLILGLAAWAVKQFFAGEKAIPPARPTRTTQEISPTERQDPNQRVNDPVELQKARFYEIIRWSEKPENSEKYGETIAKFQAIMPIAPNSRYAPQIRDNITKLNDKIKERQIIAVESNMEVDVRQMVHAGQFNDAIAKLNDYKGEYAKETAEWRKDKVELVSKKRDEYEEQKKNEAKRSQDRKFDELMAKVAGNILDQGIEEARTTVDYAAMSEEFQSRKDELKDLLKFFNNCNAEKMIMDSFRADMGKEISVQLVSGTKKIVIDDVKDGVVIGSQKITRGNATVSSEYKILLKDLSPEEKNTRMGGDDAPEVALMKGMTAYSSKLYPHAKRYFEKTHPAISKKLVEKVTQLIPKM